MATVFDRPPGSLAQVLLWLEEFPGVAPSRRQFKEAQALPSTTTLGEILLRLGVSLQALEQARIGQEESDR